MSPVRLLQVGAGQMGRAWLRTIAASPDAQLVGLVDLDLGAARKAAEECGLPNVPVSTSLADLVGRTAPDAVVDVTVPTAHRRVSTTALQLGLPVLSEKPLADSVAAGLSMIAAAERADRLLMVSQSRRYYRELVAFRQLIGQLGQVGVLHCDFFKAPHFGGFREQMPYPLLLDMAIHQFDLARDLAGGEPVAVHCTSYNPSWSWYAGDAAAQVGVEFDNGARFAFSGSWAAPGRETSWNGDWRVGGADGTATWDGDGVPTAETADGRTLSAPTGDGPEEIAGGLADFVDAVRTGRVPSGEAHTNVLSLAMVEAAIRSAQQSRTVTIAEVLETAYETAVTTEEDPELRAVLASWSSVHDAVGAGARSRSRTGAQA